jgi:hypothetical protein
MKGVLLLQLAAVDKVRDESCCHLFKVLKETIGYICVTFSRDLGSS